MTGPREPDISNQGQTSTARLLAPGSKARRAVIGLALLSLLVIPIVVRCTTAEFGMPAQSAESSRDPAGHAEAAVQRYIGVERRRGHAELVAGNDVRLLLNGGETYDAMLEAIRSARHHVHIETYIIEDDRAGRRIADALIERARAGLTVRMIYDGYGSTDSDTFFERLRAAGVRVHEYNPPEPTENIDIAEYDHRDHRKVLIVDGTVGFVGGVNFYDAYLTQPGQQESSASGNWVPFFGSGEREPAWRDTHARIEGPAVAELQKIFVEFWEQLEGAVEQARLYPELPAAGDQHVAFVVGVGGNDRPSETYAAYLDILDQGRDRIWITQAYFVPDRRILEGMMEAARRGVDVRVIVPGMTDVTLILYASRRLYGDLLGAGVRIFEYQDAILHAKTAVVDGAWTIVGSSNLDTLSTRRNHEVDAIVVGSDFAGQMERLFRADMSQSREITLAEWRDRPLGYRILGAVALWFDPWL